MFFFGEKFKKTVLALLLFCFVGIIVLPMWAHAFIVHDFANDAILAELGIISGSTVASAVVDGKEWYQEVWEIAKKIVVATVRKQTLDYIANHIIRWINNEGREPMFAGNLTDELNWALKDADSLILQDLVGIDNMNGFCNGNWLPQLQLDLFVGVDTFGREPLCTIKDIENNYNSHMESFQKGGWDKFLEVGAVNTNNPYGMYLTVRDKKLIDYSAAEESKKTELAFGNGYKGDTICLRIKCTDANGDITDKAFNTSSGLSTSEFNEEAQTARDAGGSCTCRKWQAKTPGALVGAMTSKIVTKDIDWLITNDEWENYVTAIANAAMNKIMEKGLITLRSIDITDGSVKTADGDSRGIADDPNGPTFNVNSTPPVSTLSILNDTSVQIRIEPEDGVARVSDIYYTIDGNAPVVGGADTLVYSHSINIANLSDRRQHSHKIQWFAVSREGFKEALHTQTIDYPFPDSTPPQTELVAVKGIPNTIALLPNEDQTAVYFVKYPQGDTELTPEQIEDNLYTQIITLPENGSTILKWFGVDKSDNTEDMNEMTVITPFSGNEADIAEIDLVAPTVAITLSNRRVNGEYFRVDPSTSFDSDATDIIVKYEWDFNLDGDYSDWWVEDKDRDGVFESGEDNTRGLSGNGFSDLNLEITAPDPGVVEVKYTLRTSNNNGRDISLKITDDEGVSTVDTVFVEYNE